MKVLSEPDYCDIVICKEISYVLALTKASTLQTAVCFQGWCASKHKALSALLTACRRWATRWLLKAIPPLEVAASGPWQFVLPHVFSVVLGQKCVEERVNAAIGICQARGQIVDVALGFEGQGKQGVELAQQLPDPEGQEACPEEKHNGEDQVQYLLKKRCSHKNGNHANKNIWGILGTIFRFIWKTAPCADEHVLKHDLRANQYDVVHMPG